ncbi:hypothetical protein AC790_10060 [Pantoea sp. RIT-PI-b]|uniref:hypothetical protein n=1 Tax=Pantoea sp. RIT-PI-b TaxID=1681195 RepID=UPI000676200A|nr:hypothetical protein [Pantoea sp. RIT-PI-b]KNC13349.1 hypothetical protein AC790_10060 [Pantoea sp. RIT-PI-b]
MYRSDEERLTDIIMGDAILQLLKKSGPVSTRALLDKLRIMASLERDPPRQAALSRAMTEVMHHIDVPQQSGVALKDTDNVTHIFRNRDGSGNGTKH